MSYYLLQRGSHPQKTFCTPGGNKTAERVFANFSHEIKTDGYMETFMDWPLILRSADDMWDIIKAAVDLNSMDRQIRKRD
ncbi:hypothetical protein ACG873_01200 (plasmid) [Mesorhizobium sp. AaZ16]|uniref:hypothetical protein n=1 Tax=Mesorhizobium sp. AaZ16 TaxID=3402289 RepID=UPI00374FD3A4